MAITGVDHVIVGVRDLDEAVVGWQRLGFVCTPKGRHDTWPTANSCVMLAGDYIEILGKAGPGDAMGLDAFLAQREGLMGLSWATDDADDAFAAFRAAGLAGDAPKDLSRSLDLPEGEVRLRFRLVHPAPTAPLGLAGFACQHLTPEPMRRPEWLAHPNTARRIRAVTVAVDEPVAVAGAYRSLLGDDAVYGAAEGTTVRLGAAACHFGRAEGGMTGIIGIAVEVADLSRAAFVLETAGVPAAPTNQGLTVPPQFANGVVLTLTAD